MSELMWQRIETAPKDETEVLICGLDDGLKPERFIAVAYYANGRWFEDEKAERECRPYFEPTHWMPLPALPNVI